ncbi:MAG: hypothetical protein P4L50_29110, partial [Anaerolineaceae bacterium]|nr:hypothetical protein [Anaerolineaceae bacterium]
ECHIFGLTSAFSPNQKCAAYSETVCGMLRLSVRLTPFYCAACSVFCSQARKGDAKGLFYFTTYDKVNVDTILLSPIWQRADRDDLVPLVFVD